MIIYVWAPGPMGLAPSGTFRSHTIGSLELRCNCLEVWMQAPFAHRVPRQASQVSLSISQAKEVPSYQTGKKEPMIPHKPHPTGLLANVGDCWNEV